jgi:hypothetical protein
LREERRIVTVRGPIFRFDGFIFPSDTKFEGANFGENVTFAGGTFHGHTWFWEARFCARTFFERAIFCRGISFERALFVRRVCFQGATFHGDAWFRNASFGRLASFASITANSRFSLIGARFQERVPDFLSAKFAEPVMLENVRCSRGVEPGGLLRSIILGGFLWVSGKLHPELSVRYRILKRLAIQSDHHRNEQFFFRGELRARRYSEDKPWHPSFWFGILYELASDFGHSISRPILWLIALGLLSSWFYLGQHVQADVSPRAHLQARLLSQLPDRLSALHLLLQPAKLPPPA